MTPRFAGSPRPWDRSPGQSRAERGIDPGSVGQTRVSALGGRMGPPLQQVPALAPHARIRGSQD
jgi:hypothetical protein